ncbi:hypothetical protein LTR78_008442 [Recurvomyces mirabilis]|uniref:Heterokaryon incompatibility domain-containing protein n=1 Tax=Recurvomyces mirabilis TaxID=574656 RepID=A0AAE0TQ70_9PEZI|nr:hypothetical protein LTR78_008442 [Recurvomyces mirabilis]KAK5155430.1 hypothetical protein LTS14_005691 [Recurvomyces mirabilis]
MRLLRLTQDGYAFHDFLEPEKVTYAILSHRWYAEGKDVLFDDIANQHQPSLASRQGWKKLNYASTQAAKDGIEYFWIDTCCIDRRNSAELSEAIDSVYYWYSSATYCYVYLWDIGPTCPELAGRSMSTIQPDHHLELFLDSDWFTRGWTLQEMIAPPEVRFYGEAWNLIGTAEQAAVAIAAKTRVAVEALKGSVNLHRYSIAQRMSWAASRTTTRVEDREYSLLGLLGISMPILYGERHNAFIRLQEDIINNVDKSPGRLLADSQADFASSSNVVQLGRSHYEIDRGMFNLDNRGPHCSFPIFEAADGRLILQLKCWEDGMNIGLNVAMRSAASQQPTNSKRGSATSRSNVLADLKAARVAEERSVFLALARYHAKDALDPSRGYLRLHERGTHARILLFDSNSFGKHDGFRINSSGRNLLIARHVDDSRFCWSSATLHAQLSAISDGRPQLVAIESYPGDEDQINRSKTGVEVTTKPIPIAVGRHYIGALALRMEGSNKIVHVSYMIHRMPLQLDHRSLPAWEGSMMMQLFAKPTQTLRRSAEMASEGSAVARKVDDSSQSQSLVWTRRSVLHAKLEACVTKGPAICC